MKRALMIAAVGTLLAASAWAQPYGYGYGPGHGMGAEMMRGYGPGYGMGPGMGGRGPGYGAGCNDGPGYGMGPGMMGYGPGYGGYGIPDLTPEQRQKIAGIQDETRRKQWALMQSMHELRWNEASRGSRLDEQAARKAYDAMAEVRKQMFENSVQARRQIESLLTQKQREEMGG